jgi:hypothetical protein
MKRNASLALIEQVIMLLILIVAAALCLRAFAWSDQQSLHYTDRDRAMVELQSAAEILKTHSGDFSAAAASYGGRATQTQWVLDFDENWNITATSGTYRICATAIACDVDYLGSATLTVQPVVGDIFAELTISWQEVAP